MSLDAVERQGMPFRGETGGVGAGQGMGEVPAASDDDVAAQAQAHIAGTTRRSIPLDPEMQARLDEARRAAADHGDARATARRGLRATTGSSDDHGTRSGGRRHARRPGARRCRPRLHPARPPARPAPARDRRRLLRPGRAQGEGRHGAAPVADAARRRRRSAPSPPRRARSATRTAAVARRSSWSPSRRSRGSRRASRSRTWTRLRVASRSARNAVRTPCSRTPPRASTTLLPGTARSPSASPPRTPCLDGPARPCLGRRGSSSSPGSAIAPRPCSAYPDGEALRVSLVRDQPWTGYNWYDGGYRSRVDFNVDLPIRLPDLVGTVAHETYPGHHLEHATKEQVLVEELGRLEASILLINTPECLISEGLANVGIGFAVPPDEMAGLLVELASVAGLPMADDRDALLVAASPVGRGRRPARDPRRGAHQRRADAPRRRSAAGTGDRLPGRGGADEPGHRGEAHRVHRPPLWRLYDYVYTEGEALLRTWLEVVRPVDRDARFGRLLREQLTPPAIRAETVAAAAGSGDRPMESGRI